MGGFQEEKGQEWEATMSQTGRDLPTREMDSMYPELILNGGFFYDQQQWDQRNQERHLRTDSPCYPCERFQANQNPARDAYEFFMKARGMKRHMLDVLERGEVGADVIS